MTVASDISPPGQIQRHDHDGVATLTLDRPDTGNALSVMMMAELQEALDTLAEDRAARVVVIAGRGPDFCRGHDTDELHRRRERHYLEALFSQAATLMLTITRLPQPVIAQVQGQAIAAGCQLVASCDLAIAADNARFATPGVDIGVFCSMPMVALSRAIGRKAAMEMLLTGEAVDAATAREIGLVNRTVAAADLANATGALAAQVARNSPLALTLGKEAFYQQIDMDLDGAYAYAGQVMARNLMARDAAEGRTARAQSRRPVWQGD